MQRRGSRELGGGGRPLPGGDRDLVLDEEGGRRRRWRCERGLYLGCVLTKEAIEMID